MRCVAPLFLWQTAPESDYQCHVGGQPLPPCEDRHSSLCRKSDYEKNGSNMLLMQLALGFSAGFSKKAFVMSVGQVPMSEATTP